jgi:soluble lytic murein transglycosylase
MNTQAIKSNLCSIVVASLIVGQGQMALANYHFAPLKKSVRLKQAKELLGSFYDHSVVKNGEKFRHIEEFIFSQVKGNLRDPWKPQARRLASAIMKESAKYNFDPIFLMAVIDNESTFNPETLGSFGEIGLMQVKPKTAAWIGKKYGIDYHGSKSLYDPAVNVKFGAAYLDYLRDRFESQSRLYLAAYNMGVTNVNRALEKEIWPKEYPARVIQHYLKFYAELVKSRSQPHVVFPLVVAGVGNP